MRIGVEVGGTFTDLVFEADGRLGVIKVPSTPSEPDQGALNAIDRLDVDLSRLAELVHGSTVATNAILERKGARLCLLVTEGTRDLLILQRHNRRRIYDLHYQKPVPLVRRADTFEVAERIAADGEVVHALDEAAVVDLIETKVLTGGYDAVAVCLLNSFRNPAHEETIARLVRERAPNLPITCSIDVNREFREYERCSTTVLSAFVQPVVARYLERFVESLAARGYAGPFSIMQSNGGRMPAAAMQRNAISALFSGPAAGVVGAVAAARASGFEDLITLDMGGTSTDVCLVEGGKPSLTGMVEIDGLPVKTSVIDMVTVGAGGGSIVWVDDGGMLRVGPQSAGAEPGPAGYGRGGELPTITDAHLVRGTLHPEALLGGEMSADIDAAKRSFRGVAEALGLTPEAAADSAIRVAEANIVRAIQRISTERGHDPRRFTLVPFGGAGPMLAARLAEALGIPSVVAPANAGVLSAFGLLVSDYVHFETLTRKIVVDANAMAEIRETIDTLATRVQGRLAEYGLRSTPRLEAVLEMRYVGQAFEIPVALPDVGRDAITLDRLQALFRDSHRRVFEFDHGSGGDCEVVSFRVSAAIAPPGIPALRRAPPMAAPTVPTEIMEHGARKACLRLQRNAISTETIAGPALVEDRTSTLYLPEGWRARLDDADNLIMTERGED